MLSPSLNPTWRMLLESYVNQWPNGQWNIRVRLNTCFDISKEPGTFNPPDVILLLHHSSLGTLMQTGDKTQEHNNQPPATCSSHLGDQLPGKSERQQTVALSTTKAEYMATTNAAKAAT